MRALMLFLVALVACAALLPFPGNAAQRSHASTRDFRPVIVYQTNGQKTDKAFVEGIHMGAEMARKELGVNYTEYRLMADENREAVLKKLAESGTSLIVAVGFQNVVPVLKLAEMYPNVRFTVIDGIVPPLFTNVQSVIFKDHEGAFLVGMIAAYTSQSDTIGFIGGMDVPLIRNFAYGYLQGAKYAKPKINVITSMIGTTQDAWSNPARAGELAEEHYAKGADVIFAAAGGSGLGVLATAQKQHKFAIGVDTNQNGLYPGAVLTSMVKRVDKAVYETLKNGRDNSWQPGIKYLGVKESALDFAVDNNNRNLLSKDVIDKVESAKDLIIRGTIDVGVYSPN